MTEKIVDVHPGDALCVRGDFDFESVRKHRDERLSIGNIRSYADCPTWDILKNTGPVAIRLKFSGCPIFME